MSGKAYTMKEMKTIVDYLTEHKAYNEIKGRKMWVDFERSKILDRTWQSLKETFIKRILPDIHNPYYQLSVTQISSFRNGYDVEAKINNKLEIITVSEESNASIEQAITENPSTSNGNASGKKSGEDIINTKNISQHRSSAETVVIDTCYDTAEDIQNELEGNTDEGKNNSNQSAQKSLRDFITYSEPLTPMLQEAIDDFVTDEESDSGTRMEIVEDVNTEKSKTTKETTKETTPIEISLDTDEVCNQKELPDQSKHNKENRQGDEVTTDNKEQLDKTDQEIQNAKETSVQEMSSTEDVINVQSSTDLASKQVCDIDTDKNLTEISTSNNVEENKGTQPKLNKSDKTNNIEEIATTQNTSTNTIDSIIPNNQEALNTQTEVLSITKDNESKTPDNDKEPETKSTDKDKEMQSKSRESNKRKRATSQDPTVSKIKRHSLQNKPKPVSVSDTDVGLKQSEKQLNRNSSKLLPNVYRKPKSKKQKISDTENKEGSITDKNTKGLEKVTEINEEVVSTIEVIPEIRVIKHISPEIENPCLKSVSLYEEQFTSTKYGESSDAGVAEEKENRHEDKNKEINKINSDNEILQLDTESETEPTKRKTRVHTLSSKSEKEKDLANMFGFSSGALTHCRKRRRSYRKSSHRQSRTRLLNSGSSEWTSESEGEHVSPPRGRKDRHSKKHLKPKSARILSLEEEGGLFVMYGKRIYPIVKDGKLVKNYVNYTPERDSGGEDDSYWRHKYIEEKKRTAQLTKLLHQSENNEQPSNEECPQIDLTRATPPKKPKISIPQTETNSASVENIRNERAPGAQDVEKPKETEVQNKTVKIKITKQNEEVELEGHWSQLHPVLDHVVQIFHKEVAPKSETKCTPASEQSKEVSLSGLSTPIIPQTDQVQEKVRKLETEIFEEIEARDKEVNRSSSPQSITTDTSKVTKRKEQPRRSKRSIASGPSTPEVDKSDLNAPSKAKKEQNIEKMSSDDVQNDKSPTPVARRITRTSKNALPESTDKNESKVSTRAKKGSEPSKVAKEETDVRYKFPSPPPSGKATRSAANRTTKLTNTKNRYVKKTAPVVSSLDNVIMNIVESSQGYQDSDVSPPKILRKRRLRRNILSGKVKTLSRQNIRRRSQLKCYEISDQSSNSCPNFSLISKAIQKEGYSSNSDIYRTESLQLLMPKAKTTIGINPKSKVFNAFSEQLDRIINNHCKNNAELPSADTDLHTLVNISNGNSSNNVSLPPSPVLSIVENLSIDKNTLKDVFDDNNITREHQSEECNNNDLLINNADVTMRLMEQDCDLATISNNAEHIHIENSVNTMVTDSILSKLGTVDLNQDNPTISDSLHQKIRNLLLESTKKIQPIPKVIVPEESNKMDVETNVELNRKKISKKRCSTPLKRQVSKQIKNKNPLMGAFIEEEHTDSCSQSSRRSCPPLTYNPANVEYLNPESAKPAKKSRSSRGRKNKEDIIKVKILRPKARSQSREMLTEKTNSNRESKSIHGDSGINDTESSILQQLDRSVELIHNHSETCLQTDECLDNSVEYVESHKSLICLTDSELSNNTELKDQSGTDSDKNTQCEFLIGDRKETISCNVIPTSPAAVSNCDTYHPMLSRESPDSLMTEDLSEPEQEQEQISVKASKWYLLSEDENTNSNFPQNLDYGSDLDKLFPVACAVPNLSTITEMSKENDKPVDPDGDTRNDLLSQSLFDSNL